MKFRSSFITNSSSSSFIITPNGILKTVFDVVKIMLLIRDANSDDYESKWKPSARELIAFLDEAKENGIDLNFPITFSTCNYDTFIAKVDV